MGLLSHLARLFVSSKKKSRKGSNDGIALNTEDSDTIAELQRQIQSLQAKCDELKQTADSKTAELADFQKQVFSGADGVDKDLILKIQYDNDERVKKLKRELEDAEEELEYSESTVKKLKRQLEEKLSENGQLIDDLSAAKRSINKLTSTLEATRNDLEETSRKLDSVSGSLAFVQEVLKAKPISSETLVEKDKKIKALSDFVFFDLQELFKQFKQFFPSTDSSDYIFGQGLRQWEAVKRKSWIEGKKTIAFIGEFSAGKTSIVNRILSQDNPSVTLLPVSTKATTAIPTYIAGGDFTTYQFYTPDGKLKSISEESFKKVNKEILGNIKGVDELIRYFVMTYQNPHLTGMSILDTPGFSSGDQEDAVRTIDVINECDALFWVFDVNAGTVNRSSLEVIKTNMTRPLYVIINKIDTKATSEIDAVENLIRKAFEDEGIKVEGYLRFSSQAPLDELMNTITTIENDCSAEEYLTTLMDDFFSSLIKTCEKNNKEAANAFNASNKKCGRKLYAINKLCLTIQNDSKDAADIPHWEKHIFRKNRWEMDASEGELLISLLNKVDTDSLKLPDEITEYGALMQENQDTFKRKNEAENILRLFKDHRSKLKRLITDLNR